ncbi:LapA family protein [bacterium]|nr:LapA family protein [bacterium]
MASFCAPKARPFLISGPYLEVNAVWVLRMLLLLILVVVVTGFAMLNSGERATITLGTAGLTFNDVPLVLLLFEAFVLGAVVWFFVSVVHEISLRNTIRRQKREIADLVQETAGLRHISLDEIDEEGLDD